MDLALPTFSFFPGILHAKQKYRWLFSSSTPEPGVSQPLVRPSGVRTGRLAQQYSHLRIDP